MAPRVPSCANFRVHGNAARRVPAFSNVIVDKTQRFHQKNAIGRNPRAPNLVNSRRAIIGRDIVSRVIDAVIAMERFLGSAAAAAAAGERANDESASIEGCEMGETRVARTEVSNAESVIARGALLQEARQQLGLVKLCSPKSNWSPRGYRENSDKEKLLLWHAENFRRQFHVLYPHRRPLLLACDNEFGVQVIIRSAIFFRLVNGKYENYYYVHT